MHGDLVPLAIEGRIIGKGSPGRPRVGMLDRVKDARQPLCNGQEERLRTRTIRKDLLWAEHTQTHTHISDQYIWRGAYIQGAYYNCNHLKGLKGFFFVYRYWGGGGGL